LNKICIALDAMGGDHGPEVIVPAAIGALKNFPRLHLILVGDKSVLASYLAQYTDADLERITTHHASEQVLMDESPANALRNKKDSSMRVALNLVKSGDAQACVSAGNTGALMAIARFVLKTLPGIDRPAIVYQMPNRADKPKMGHMRMLDLGANVDCQGEHLFQFAVMGAILSKAADGIHNPRVALLNIGAEEIKGTEAIKQAAQLLSEFPSINYTGFVEPYDMFQGQADVVVCDGFAGNIALKTSESISKMFVGFVKIAFARNLYTKLVACLAKPILNAMRNRFDTSKYNGASFLGLNGIVIKSHGNANVIAFTQAIKEAVVEVEKNVPEQIRTEVANYLAKRTSA